MSGIQPHISVCMPTFNQARYLPEAVDSVLHQTWKDFELIVFDDASSDDTALVIRRFSDERIRYFRQNRNVGIARNRNDCLAVATGRYIAWLDSDDSYHLEMLARQSAVLDARDQVGLIYGAFDVMDASGQQLPAWPLPFSSDIVEKSAEAFAELSLCNYITTATVMVRRSSHDRAGLFAAEIGRSSTDWDMWLRIALDCDVAYTAFPVARYRQHGDSISSLTSKNSERLQCDERVLNHIFTKRAASAQHLERRAKAALAARFFLYAGERFAMGDRSEATQAASHALAIAGWLNQTPMAAGFLKALSAGNEYEHYRRSRALLGRLHDEFQGSRFAKKIAKYITHDPQRQKTLADIARSVRRVVPPSALIAVVDKADPTLLHLSRRRGHHFPDWHLAPPGYPRDSAAAIAHLEQLQALGVSYIVFPSPAFWWLEHYQGLRARLEKDGKPVWSDEQVLIYHLGQQPTPQLATTEAVVNEYSLPARTD